MFRRLLAATLAFSVASAPFASAEQYFFRYKQPVSQNTPPVNPGEQEPEEYGVGNDIVAYYVAPVGYDFSKKIPVSTSDVVDWRRSSGDWPSGIALDERSGEMKGRPTAESQRSLLYRGWDAAGNRIARAQLNFTVFDPVGTGTELAFYAHAGKYFYQTIPLPQGVDVYRWEPIIDYPAGMKLNGLVFEGTPEKSGTYGIAWRGFDYIGREVAFAFGEFLVEDGPKIEHIADQIADLSRNEFFAVNPVVRHSVGKLSYKLLPITAQPPGLQFSSSLGTVGGRYGTYDTSASFKIRVTDFADGTFGDSNVFSLATLPAAADLSKLQDLQAVVGQRFWLPVSSASVAPGATWEVTAGALPDGLTLGRNSGIIDGVAERAQVQTGIRIRVTGPGTVTAESAEFTFRVFPETFDPEFRPLVTRTNASFSTTPPTAKHGQVAPFVFEIAEGAELADGLSLDAATGVVSSSGIATAGRHDVSITATNGDGVRSGVVFQPIDVRDGLSISYASATVRRYERAEIVPDVDEAAVVGAARYALAKGQLPSFATFSPFTGRITVTPTSKPDEGVYGPFQVTISDETGADVPSGDFTITVEDRAAVEISQDNASVQRFVMNQKPSFTASNTVGSATYKLVSGNISTLSISESGWLVGTTTDPIGTQYTDIVVSVTDADGVPVISQPFSFTVVTPEALAPLNGSGDVALTWTKGVPFSLDLPVLSSTYGNVTYGLDDASAFVSIVAGKATGTASTSGSSIHSFSISDESGRAPFKGTLTLDIREPMSGGTSTSHAAHLAAPITPIDLGLQNGIDPITFGFSGNADLPLGVTYSNGTVVGTPQVEGTFGPFTIKATDAAGTVVAGSFNLVVGPPLPLDLAYTDGQLVYGQEASGIRYPDVKNRIGPASFKLAAGGGKLPRDVRFNDALGTFYGVPTETGRFPGIIVTVTDGGLDTKSPSDDRTADATVMLEVTRAGSVSLKETAFKVRAGLPFQITLTATNAVDPVVFSSSDAAGMKGALVLSESGILSGNIAVAGVISDIGVRATDEMGRETVASLTIEALDGLAAQAPATTSFRQYAPGSAEATTSNLAGGASWRLSSSSAALPEGLTLDPSTGALSGVPSVAGTFGPYVLVAKDSFDGSEAPTPEFQLQIDPRAALAVSTPAAIELKRFGEASAMAVATNAIGAVSYSVSPALPDGFTLGTDGSITGLSDIIVPSAEYVLTATDSKGGVLGTATSSFTLSVAERDPLLVSLPSEIPFKQYAQQVVTPTVYGQIGPVSWTISPSLPTGLSLDPATGAIGGRAASETAAAQYALTATDSKGGALGTSTTSLSLSVAARDPLQLSGSRNVVFDQFFGGDFAFKAENAIGATSYSISPAPADWFTFNPASGTLSGLSEEMRSSATYTITARDEFDSVSETISVSVGPRRPLEILPSDGPLVLEGLLDYPFNTALGIRNQIGGTSWSVSGQLPAGIDLDAATGRFHGTLGSYGEYPGLTLTVTDSKDGVAQKPLTISVKQDGSPISVAGATASAHTGSPMIPAQISAANTVGKATFSMTGLEKTGLTINSDTGTISGTAKLVGTFAGTVYVSDITGRVSQAPVNVTLYQPMLASITSNSTLLYNREAAGGVTATATLQVGGVAWSVKSGTLPLGLSVNAASGQIVGKPAEIGTFGPIIIEGVDSIGGHAETGKFSVKVEMNQDPIDLAVENVTVHVGDAVRSGAPTVDNALGNVIFFSTELSSLGLSIDPSTGVVSGTAGEAADRIINVSVRDSGTLRVTSKPMRIKVFPPMQASLPATTTLTALDVMPVLSPTLQYAIGGVAWDALGGSGVLPAGVSYDRSTGKFSGTPTDLGTFGPFVVSGVDSQGSRASTGPISITVVPGPKFLGLAGATLADAEKRQSYSFDFNTLATTEGFEPSDPITWAASAGNGGSWPIPGLTFDQGMLSGTPSAPGIYTFEVSVSGLGMSSRKTFELNVALPDISLDLAAGAMPAVKQFSLAKADFKPHLTLQKIPVSAVVWSVADQTGKPIDGASFTNGILQWSPTVAGEQVVVVTATFADGTELANDTQAYTIAVERNVGADGTPHRYWRFLSLSAGDGGSAGQDDWYTNLAEIEFRANGSDVNALGSFSTLCCYSGSMFPITDALDKNWDTFWHSPDTSFESRVITVDFKTSPQAINSLYLVRRDPAYGQAPIKFEVQFSDDGANWITGWVDENRDWTGREYTSVLPN